jgi:hypothetical protein
MAQTNILVCSKGESRSRNIYLDLVGGREQIDAKTR